jgi:ABC-type branched-subunit amino acid transport system ATPase component
MTAAVLQIEGLVKHFGGLHVLDGVDLDLAGGRIVGLLGPNGSGKTTLFNVITGLVSADAGAVRFEGRNIVGLPPDVIARAGLVRTFQLSRIFSELTVWENLLVPGGPDAARVLARRHAARLLERVGLDVALNVPAGSLSYGQRKLLELARALVPNPELLLLDEPFAGINPVLCQRVADVVRSLVAEGRTCFVVGHEMALMMSLCDEVAVLHAGHLIFRGEPRACRRDPAVMEAYMGTGRRRA